MKVRFFQSNAERTNAARKPRSVGGQPSSGGRRIAEHEGHRLGRSLALPRRFALPVSRVSRHPRRGAFFNYVLVYLTVSSALMTAAGLCLHSVLKADNTDRRAALFLSSLMRAEHQLRSDSRDSGVVLESASELTSTTDEVTVRWTANRSILTRTATVSDKLSASERYVFPAGAVIEMAHGPEGSVVVRVTESSAFVTYSQSGSGGSNLNKTIEEASPATPEHVAQPKSVEIRLRGAQP